MIASSPLEERENYTLLRRGVQGVVEETDENVKSDKMPVIPVSRQDGGSPYGRDRFPRGGLYNKGVYGADAAIDQVYELHAYTVSGS